MEDNTFGYIVELFIYYINTICSIFFTFFIKLEKWDIKYYVFSLLHIY